MIVAEQQLSQPEECFASLPLLFFVCLCVQQSTLLSSARPDAMLFLFKIPTSDFPFVFLLVVFFLLFFFASPVVAVFCSQYQTIANERI